MAHECPGCEIAVRTLRARREARSAFQIPDPTDDDPERDRFIDHNDVTEEEATDARE